MQSGRGHADEHIADRNRAPVDQPLTIDDADDETGEIVLAIGIDAGHLRGLAAEERAAVVAARGSHPTDDRLGDRRRQPTGGEIVEKEQRLGALHEDVVDAVIDEIDTDRVVLVGEEGDLQLGANAIGARDEHRMLVSPALELKQAAEGSDVRQHS